MSIQSILLSHKSGVTTLAQATASIQDLIDGERSALRDQFASTTLQGYLSHMPVGFPVGDHLDAIAEMAYRLADAMVVARQA